MKLKSFFDSALFACLLITTPLFAHENYANRDDVQAFIKDMQTKNNFNADVLNGVFANVEFQPSVIKAILPPASPGVRSWSRYKPRFVNAQRIKKGHLFMVKYADSLQRAAETYNVPAEIIASIIGIETIYGVNKGNYRVIDALTTLAFDYPKRAEYFKGELAAYLLLCREQNWDFFSVKGSYAGAIGLPQFMPSSIRRLAVDFDHDGVIDLRNNPIDAIGSVANYFRQNGWQTDGPIAIPIDVTEPLPDNLLQDITPKLSYAEVSHLKFLPQATEHQHLLESNEKFAFIPLVSPDLPTEYWLGFQNFYVITRYNKSSFYAMSVLQLAEALK